MLKNFGAHFVINICSEINKKDLNTSLKEFNEESRLKRGWGLLFKTVCLF